MTKTNNKILNEFLSGVSTIDKNTIEIKLIKASFAEWIRISAPWLEKINKVITQNPDKTFHISYSTNPVPSIILTHDIKKKYEKIFTSGCFDLLHYGHLNILQRSKELCNQLIVGVSTDELIEREKGRRPLIPYSERVKLIASIKYVDLVIPQEDKNKQQIVDKYHIDAITVGDDWKGKYPPVTCDLIFFSYTPNVSSTIIKKALNF